MVCLFNLKALDMVDLQSMEFLPTLTGQGIAEMECFFHVLQALTTTGTRDMRRRSAEFGTSLLLTGYGRRMSIFEGGDWVTIHAPRARRLWIGAGTKGGVNRLRHYSSMIRNAGS